MGSKKLMVLGLMSGTSLDGLDLAIVDFDGWDSAPRMNVLRTAFQAYPQSLREKIAQAFGGNSEQICRLNIDLAEVFAENIREMTAELSPEEQPDIIASHGQTICHVPMHSTLQIGEADIIARRTNLPVIYGFRSADVACGGSGAPLVPIFDKFLANPFNESTAFQNLGGIGNVTHVPANRPDDVTAFDTGPANMLTDQLMLLHSNGETSYDKDGTIAKSGMVLPEIVQELLRHPYLAQRPPKSTGFEEFGRAYAQMLLNKYKHVPFPSLIRSAIRFVASTIANTYRDHLPQIDRIYISGGGLRNPVLMDDLSEMLGREKLQNFEEQFGFNPDFKEAVAFAYLGYCRCRGLPSNVPAATGATKHASLGKIAFPD